MPNSYCYLAEHRGYGKPEPGLNLADHLSSTDESTQYLALEGLRNITHEVACSPSESSNTENLEWRVRQCKLWWKEKGKFQPWGSA